ncbi:MAG: hypothetical protein IPP64_00970 [Bacteroidetes bacterium]|nr:hypothetical protein [Bacteroidota bacterium]
MKNKIYAPLIILCCIIVLFWNSKNSFRNYTTSDPQLTLLTSQSILENGTTNLYRYFIKTTPSDFADGDWKYSYWEKEQKVYYFYPLGTSLVCLPIVGVARILGYDFTNKSDDALWQSNIASGCVVIIFILLFFLASKFVSFIYALLFSFLICVGSTVSSTIGMALWSFNFEIIFLLLAFNLLAKNYTDPKNINGILLGFYLYSAWLCRPSSLIVFFIVGFWLFKINRHALKQYVLTIFILYIPFGIYAITHFNIVVPAYYHPLFWMHKKSTTPLSENFLAILFSPARGLFLFTPVLLLSFYGVFVKEARKHPLYMISLIWFVIHTFMLARQPNWWGGWSYGPRLFSDALIPLFIMFIISFEKSKHALASKLILTLFFLLSIPGIFIHTIKGATDIQTYKWNDHPAIDDHIDYYIWNFQYPQFSADSVSNQIKKSEFALNQQLSRSVLKLRKGDCVLFENDSPLACTTGKNLNTIAPYTKIRLFCNLDQLLKTEVDTFYITPGLLKSFSSDSNFVMVQPSLKNLGDYLEKHKMEHVFLSTKYNLFKKISPQTGECFTKMHSNIFKLKNEQGFVAHLYKGKIMTESLGQNKGAKLETDIGDHKISASSDGKNSASIKIDGKEYSINDGGFNIVCVDDSGNLLDVARFNTQFIDAEYVYLFQFYKKNK